MAQSYAEWHQRASEADRAGGGEAARAQDDSPYFDASALRQCIAELNSLKDRGDVQSLEDRLHEELRRHLNDLYAPELYRVALAGPQYVVTDFLDCVCACLEWLADHEGIPLAERRRRFTAAWTIYGRSALMLSGGATWGFAHLGVVKALFAQGLFLTFSPAPAPGPWSQRAPAPATTTSWRRCSPTPMASGWMACCRWG